MLATTRLYTAIAAAAVLSLVFVPSVLADEGDEPSPSERYAELVKTFPTPSDEIAFEFKGTVVFGGQEAGEFHFAAGPKMNGEDVCWELLDEMKMMGGELHRKQVAVVGKNLDVVRGEASEKAPHRPRVVRTFTRDEKGISVVQQAEGGTAVNETVDPDALSTTGLCSLFLLARLGMPEDGTARGTFETLVFSPEIGGNEPMLEPGTITFKGLGTWNEKPAYLVSGTKGDAKAIEIALDPKSREILGVRLSEEGGPSVELKPDAEPSEGGFFGEPAKTPEQAASQALLGFATAALDVLEQVIHWPTMYANASAEDQEKYSEGEFQALIMEQLSGNLKPQVDRAMMEGLLSSVQGLTKEEQDNGWVIVAFPAMFQGFKALVGEFDGRWYLTKFPNK